MNKRQKKKLVKKAIYNTVTLKASKKDKHVLNTFGTSERVWDSLNTKRLSMEINECVENIKRFIQPIIEAYVEVYKIVREKIKDLNKERSREDAEE